MYSERLLEHFRNPRHTGDLEDPAVRVEVTNPACGDILQLSARVTPHTIERAAYRVRGCTASIACGSALTEWLTGRNCAELGTLDAAALAAMVGGLEPASQHAAVLSIDALRALRRRITSS